MKKYPEWRVIIGFSLCPIVGSFLFLCIHLFCYPHDLIEIENNLFWQLVALFAIFVYLCVIALIFYFPPAFISAAIYVSWNLKRNAHGYISTGFFGGMSVIFWNIFMAGTFPVEMKSVIFSFILGAFSSLVAARLVLPECERNKDAVCAESES